MTTAQQSSLFDMPVQAVSIYNTPLPPFVKTSETSKAAAKAIAPHLHPLERKVYEYLCDRGIVGSTDLEGQAALGLKGDTYRARRIKLVELGKVVDSGETRLTDSRRAAAVWIVTE